MSQKKSVQSAAAATFNPSSFLDVSQPNLARVFNYLTGGSAYFEIDRTVAEQMLAEFPPLKKLVQLSRAFTVEAVQHLYEVEGFRQFLDLGSGIPSGDMVHQLVPDAMFVYSDINPVAVSYGVHLLAGLAEVAYVYGNAREIGALLANEDVRQRLRFDEKLAVGLNNIPIFLSEAELRLLAKTLYERLAVGSQLSFFLLTRASEVQSQEADEAQGKLQRMGVPVRYADVGKVCDLLWPWKPKLVEMAINFMGLPADFLDDVAVQEAGLALYALFFVKE
ncbi:MAG: SAM-dependent methyltransferase [Chloroflexota bacterium]